MKYADVEKFRKKAWVNPKKVPPLYRYLDRTLRRIFKGGGADYVEYIRKWQALSMYGDCNFLGDVGHRCISHTGGGGNGKSKYDMSSTWRRLEMC